MNICLNNINIELTPNIQLDCLQKEFPKAEWWKNIIEFLELWANDSAFVQLKTSGSTGEPKVIEVEKAKLWVSATKTCDFFSLNNTSLGLLCLSANYIAGKMMLVRAMVSGMNLICVEPSGNPTKNLNTTIDFAAMVPMQVKQSLSTTNNLNRIKQLIIGGGQVSSSLISDLSVFRGNAYETFGMTETLSHIALKQLTPNHDNYFIPFNGVYILQGFNNTMVIDFPELGIYKMKTNDIIEINNSTGTFVWKGRSDFIINSGGVKISPEEVEQQIEHLIKQRFCIIGLPNEKLGEEVILVIEGEPYDTTALYIEIKNNLSSYSCPKEIRFIKELPLTESRKIRRKEISL